MSKLVKLERSENKEDEIKRLERGQDLAARVEIICWAGLPSQRWTAFVHNGYTSAVVLSHKCHSGKCSCEDFKKRLLPCKHIFAAMMAINKAVEKWYDSKNDERRKIALDILQRETAEKVASEHAQIKELKLELDEKISSAIACEQKLEKVSEALEVAS